jgi:hypothetical protein
MNRSACWIAIGVLLAGFVAVVGYLLGERRMAGRDLPAYSVYSEARDGLGEAAFVLRRLGWTPVAVTRPIHEGRQRGLLILAEPPSGNLIGGDALSKEDALVLLHWVERGNTLLLLSHKNTALHEALKVEVVADSVKHGDETFHAVDLEEAGVYTKGISRLSVGSRTGLLAPRDALPLWWLDDRPAAVVMSRKAGRILIVADARFLTREGLVRSDGVARDDNVVFLANVAAKNARDGKVYFDEYHHGLRSGGGFWGYLEAHGERATPLLILVVLLIAGWTWAVRLGPAVPKPTTSSTDAVDYASALARLYQKTGTRRLLARTLVRGFLGELTRHLRLRRNALPAEILAAWRQHDAGPSLTRLQALLRGVGELRRGEASERQLLEWTRAFGEFTKDFLDR